MDIYINSCEDAFEAIAVIRQFYDVSFAEARDLVTDLPKKLPPLAMERFGELFSQLSAVGVNLSTGQPLQQQKDEPERKSEPEPERRSEPINQLQSEEPVEASFSMDDIFSEVFNREFSNFSTPSDPTPTTPSRPITNIDTNPGTGEFSESDSSQTPGQWYVQLDDVGPIKLAIVKIIKDNLDIGLREAMEFVSSAPACLPLTGLNEFQVDQLIDELISNGAKASAHFL